MFLKYIIFFIILGGIKMGEGVYRGIVEYDFISMFVFLIVISREIRRIGLVIWNMNFFLYNFIIEWGESFFL